MESNEGLSVCVLVKVSDGLKRVEDKLCLESLTSMSDERFCNLAGTADLS